MTSAVDDQCESVSEREPLRCELPHGHSLGLWHVGDKTWSHRATGPSAIKIYWNDEEEK